MENNIRTMEFIGSDDFSMPVYKYIIMQDGARIGDYFEKVSIAKEFIEEKFGDKICGSDITDLLEELEKEKTRVKSLELEVLIQKAWYSFSMQKMTEKFHLSTLLSLTSVELFRNSEFNDKETVKTLLTVPEYEQYLLLTGR